MKLPTLSLGELITFLYGWALEAGVKIVAFEVIGPGYQITDRLLRVDYEQGEAVYQYTFDIGGTLTDTAYTQHNFAKAVSAMFNEHREGA